MNNSLSLAFYHSSHTKGLQQRMKTQFIQKNSPTLGLEGKCCITSGEMLINKHIKIISPSMF